MEDDLQNDLQIVAIDRNFWLGKNGLKLVDVERAYLDVGRLEDGVNRCNRQLKKWVFQNADQINKIAKDTNMNIETLQVQMHQLGERVDELTQWKVRTQGNPRRNMIDFNNMENHNQPPPFEEENPENHNRTNNEDNFIDDGMDAFGLFSLTAKTGNLEPFGEESVIAFDKWVEKFVDYVDAMGRNWDEEEKVARLKLALVDVPRKLFKGIPQAQLNTVKNAIKALREKLDSPQKRELAKRTLGMCKQKEGETVSQFLQRLSPLVEIVNSTMNEPQMKEKICEELLERIRPNIGFLIKLVGLSKTKNLDMVMAQAEELEALLDSEKGNLGIIPQTVQAINTQNNVPEASNYYQQSSSSYRAQTPPPSDYPQGRYQNELKRAVRFNPVRNNSKGTNWKNRNRNQSRPFNRPQNQRRINDRNWSNRPNCTFCGKVGHTAMNCFQRKKEFDGGNQSGNQYQRQDNYSTAPLNSLQNPPGTSLNIDANELVKAIATMSLQNNRLSSQEIPNNRTGTMNAISKVENDDKMIRRNVEENTFKLEIEKIKSEAPKKTSNWESSGIGPKLTLANHLLLIMIFLFGLTPCSAAFGLPNNPMICQTQKEGTVWKLPEIANCSKINLNYTHSPIPVALVLYTPNIFEREVDAWACRKVRKGLRKYTALSGVPIEQFLDPENLPINHNECQQMINEGECSLGKLINESGLFHTDLEIDRSPRRWLIGTFNWKKEKSDNCYLFKTKIMTKFGNPAIQSHLGETGQCRFEEGSCRLEDNTLIHWKTNGVKNCEFRQIGIWKGRMLGTAWLSDEKRFMLTFSSNSSKVNNCGNELILSDQGFAVENLNNKPRQNRRRRSRRGIDSLVTSSQLAAQLTYLDTELGEMLSFSMNQAIQSICDHIEENRRWASAALLSDPITLARNFFENPELTAKRVGPNLVKIWPCIPLGPNEFEFVPLEGLNPAHGECFERIPIKLKINGQEQMSFVDPKTMIISSTARKGPCEEYGKQILIINGELLEVDQVTTKTTKIKVNELRQSDFIKKEISPLSIHAFHQLVITNVSDILTHAYIASSIRVSQLSYKIVKKNSKIEKSLGEEWQEVKDEIAGSILGDWTYIWRILVTMMALIAFCETGIRIFLIVKERYKDEARLAQIKFDKSMEKCEIVRGTNRKSTLKRKVTETDSLEFTPIRMITPNKRVNKSKMRKMSKREVNRQKLDSSDSDNDRKVIVNMIRTSLNNQTTNCPVILARTNQKVVVALIDTGAEITVAPKSIVETWTNNISEATGTVYGLGQQEIKIIGQVHINFLITGEIWPADVMVIEDTPNTFAICDLIIGVDTIRKLEVISFDFVHGGLQTNKARNTDTSSEPSTSNQSTTGIELKTEYGKWLNSFILGELPNIPENYRKPINGNELLNFVGVAAYYKHNIPNFKTTIEPLRKLVESMKCNNSLHWHRAEQKAYESILGRLRFIVKGEGIDRMLNMLSPISAINSSIDNRTFEFNNLENKNNLQLSRINTLAPSSSVALAKINGIPIQCLIDTGASMSVAPRSMAEQLKCKILPTYMEARSASGHKIALKEKGQVQVNIAGFNLAAYIHFVEDSEVVFPKNYQLILGCDVFEKLPKITLDYSQGKLFIGEENWTELGTKSLAKLLKINSIENITIPPSSQLVIQGKLESAIPIENPILIDELNEKLGTSNLGIISSVSVPLEGKIPIAIINPTASPIIIYKGTNIAYANELEMTEEGLVEGEMENIMSLNRNDGIKIDPTFVVDYSKCCVIGDELEGLKKLIDEFNDIFSKSQYDLGTFTGGEHHITTTTEDPVFSAPRRMPYKYRDELNKHIEQLLASGVMVESDTPWVTPFVPVRKKDGGMRPCLDFRKLNDVTIPDRYPLPRLDSIMEKVGNCNFYSSIDLSSGYLQIKLSEETSWKCGVITEDKIYRMVNMPFGMKNATAAFSRAMSVVLCGLEDCALSYVDDILVFTKNGNFNDHLISLRKVFERFRLYNLKLSPKKCIFATKEMNFLGYTINSNGYKPSLSRIEIIKDMPIPTNVKEVKRVLGKAGFYRRHIANFSTIVEPLVCLTRQQIPFEWTSKQQEAFDKIKELLSQEPNLIFPDYSKSFHIFTDASTVGQGGVLMQKNEETNSFSAISYCSRTLSASERKWPAVQVELSAIIYSLREFKAFIFMSDIELHTDHRPLAYLLKKTDTHPQLARWLIELQTYQIKIVHIAGKANTLADALSRAAENVPIKDVENLKELEDIVEFPICFSISQKSRIVHPFTNSITLRHQDGNSYDIDLAKEQREDPECVAYIKFLEIGEYPIDISELEKETFVSQIQNLCIISDILYFKKPKEQAKIYVPISLRLLVFESFHTSPLGGGHMNIRKTLAKCRKYYWPHLYSDILHWVKSCITCQLKHSPTPGYKAEMLMVPADTLFAKVGLDLAGPFPLTSRGNKHILNIVCWFSKYVVSVALPDAKAHTIARAFLLNCYLKFGGCTEIVTDSASSFTSDFFKYFTSMLYINQKYAIPHWSQGNGATERTFRTFNNTLAKYINKDQPDFDEFLDFVNFSYNTSIHSTTGESPFFLVFGRDPIYCVDLILDSRVRNPVAFTDESEFREKLVVSLRKAWTAAAEANKEAQLKMKEQYDKKYRLPTIKIGDRVLLRNYDGKKGTSKKFHLPWKGQFRVIDIDGIYVTIVSCISPQSNPKRVHINQLKKCYEVVGPACTLPKLPLDEQEKLIEAGAEEMHDTPGYNHQQLMKEQTTEKINEEKVELSDKMTNENKYELRPRNKIKLPSRLLD